MSTLGDFEKDFDSIERSNSGNAYDCMGYCVICNFPDCKYEITNFKFRHNLTLEQYVFHILVSENQDH